MSSAMNRWLSVNLLPVRSWVFTVCPVTELRAMGKRYCVIVKVFISEAEVLSLTYPVFRGQQLRYEMISDQGMRTLIIMFTV